MCAKPGWYVLTFPSLTSDEATYDSAVGWICAEDPGHPPYRMSPFTRAKRSNGCSLCARRTEWEAARGGSGRLILDSHRLRRGTSNRVLDRA